MTGHEPAGEAIAVVVEHSGARHLPLPPHGAPAEIVLVALALHGTATRGDCELGGRAFLEGLAWLCHAGYPITPLHNNTARWAWRGLWWTPDIQTGDGWSLDCAPLRAWAIATILGMRA